MTASGEGLLDAAGCAMVAFRRAEHVLRECAAAVDEAGIAGPSGYRSTSRLLQDVLRIDPGEAKRLLCHGEALRERTSMSGEPLPARLPATAAAAADGVVGSGHIRVITRVMERLGRVDGLDPSGVADAEELLAGQARVLSPVGLARVGARLLATLDPDGEAPEEAGEPEGELHLARRRDGTLIITALIRGGADAEMVVEVLDALAVVAGPGDPRSLAHRRAEALLDLCAQALSPTGIATPDHDPAAAGAAGEGEGGGAPRADAGAASDGSSLDEDTLALDDVHRDETPGAEPPTDPAPTDTPTELPIEPPAGSERQERRPGRVLGRALLTLTIDHRWLREQLGHGLLDSDTTLSPTEARRLACDAGIVPLVLGSHGEPLDVGRLAYTVPEGLRRALHHRDRGCSFPGCTRRPKRCHAHHVRHWSQNGATALDNLTLLCRYHHHLVHHGDWTITMVHGRPWFTPPRWVDHQRQPRPGGPHPLHE